MLALNEVEQRPGLIEWHDKTVFFLSFFFFFLRGGGGWLV